MVITQIIVKVIVINIFAKLWRDLMSVFLKQDLKKRKDFLKVIAKSKSSWKLRIMLTVLLFLISISIFIGVGYVLYSARNTITPMTVIIFVMMAICLACVPFFLGISVKNSAKYSCAAPYSGMTNGSLLLDGNKLEYIFWKASKEAPGAYSSKRALYLDENKFTYCFDKQNIKSLTIDEYHICYITGNGTITVPIWESTNDTIETRKVSQFSFLVSFDKDDAERIIKDWRNT